MAAEEAGSSLQYAKLRTEPFVIRANVKGYLYWSLLDNFEWQAGFGKTFGLIAVDRETQTRYPRESLKVLGMVSQKTIRDFQAKALWKLRLAACPFS